MKLIRCQPMFVFFAQLASFAKPIYILRDFYQSAHFACAAETAIVHKSEHLWPSGFCNNPMECVSVVWSDLWVYQPNLARGELTPGDRVEGLGNFGKPTGEFGTVERANEEDAVVKWDDDGRTRLGQPSLKKI